MRKKLPFTASFSQNFYFSLPLLNILSSQNNNTLMLSFIFATRPRPKYDPPATPATTPPLNPGSRDPQPSGLTPKGCGDEESHLRNQFTRGCTVAIE